MKHRKRSRRPRISDEHIEEVSQKFQRSPRTSLRRASLQLNIPLSTLQRIIHKKLNYHAYKLQVVQNLLPTDRPQQREFGMTMLLTCCIKLGEIEYQLDKLRATNACDKGKTFGTRETSALCVKVAINTLLSPLSESSYRCKCDNITLFLNMLFEKILSRCVIPKSPRRNYGRDISPINGIHLRTVFKEPRGLGGMHVRSKNRNQRPPRPRQKSGTEYMIVWQK
uniref:HTH psq-type domain-containing protein n=1 Tax=Strigamia maritima TaxID=126957 RepID=T1JF30_STRMM